MKRTSSAVVSLFLGVVFVVSQATPAHADFRTIINEWYYTYTSCMVYGRMLTIENPIYYGPSCSRNGQGRYTLYMWVRGGNGGGGGGSWSVDPIQR